MKYPSVVTLTYFKFVIEIILDSAGSEKETTGMSANDTFIDTAIVQRVLSMSLSFHKEQT
jgi:hypothetical protein